MRVFIIGVGRMGSWFAKVLSMEHEVAVYDRDLEKADMLKDKDVEAIRDLSQLDSFAPEIVINAVSLKDTIPAFKEVRPYLGETTIISDIASVKGELSNYYEGVPFEFVSLHPMFGPTFADMGSLKGEGVIFIKGSNKEGVRFFEGLFKSYGLRIFESTFDEHDRMMAYSLALPFIASMAFAASVEKETVPGITFARHLNIARGLLSEDDQLLTEIMFNIYALPEIDKIASSLQYLKHIIKEKDQEELGQFFKRLRKNIE